MNKRRTAFTLVRRRSPDRAVCADRKVSRTGTRRETFGRVWCAVGRPAHNCASAFTLLEVMLAVTMLGLLVIAVSSTWSAGLRGWKRSNGLAEMYQRQRIVLDALTELTQAAIYVPERAKLYAVRAERDPFLGDSISFVTSSDALLPPQEAIVGGMRRVTVGMARDDNGQPCLTMLNIPALQEVDKLRQPVGHVLGRDVVGFAVRYRDAQTGVWKDNWTEADHFPAALEFAITFAGKEPLVVVRTVDLPTAKLLRQQR